MKNELFFLLASTLLATSLAQATGTSWTPWIPPPPVNPTTHIPPVDISGQVSRTVNSSIASRTASANVFIPELQIRNFSGKVEQMQVSSNQHFLSLLLADGTSRIWDLDLGVQRPMIITPQTKRIVVDARQQIVFTGNVNGIDSYDVLTGQPLAKLPFSPGVIHDLAVSADQALLLISSASQQLGLEKNTALTLAANNTNADASAPLASPDNHLLSLWDTRTNKMRWQQSDFNGIPGIITIAENNRYAAVVCQQNNPDRGVLEIRDMNTGKKLQTLSNHNERIVFSRFNSDTGIEVGYNNGEIITWDLQTALPLTTKKVSNAIVTMDKAGDIYASVLDNGSVLITDAQGNQLTTIAKENNPIKTVILLAQGKKLLTATETGQIFLWNVADGKELLQLISTKQGWTVVDNTGRFDSSEAGMPNVSWLAGGQDIPLDNTATRYYEPGLFSSALNDESYLNPKPQMITEGMTLPPKLEVLVSNAGSGNEEVELSVNIYDQGGGIEAVNFYHNAKAINLQRAVVSDKTLKEQDQERRTLTLKIKPTAGENQVKAIASNKMGIENQSNEVLFNANIPAPEPSLKVVTIGINQYSDKKLNLDYSVADAESIEQLLIQKRFAKLTTISKRQLYNQDASKALILSVLRELSHGEKQDILAIYFAGHGISVNGEWYFLPYETTLRADLNYFASVGVSASEISDIFKDSSIQHILLMIDSCYSGASLDSFKKLQNSQRKFSRTISRSVGITIVTATRKNQQAAELSDLGHGLFTYALGKGIRGEADFMPEDNLISAHELADFSTQMIPNFAKKYVGSAQEPTAFTMGHDFVLLNKK